MTQVWCDVGGTFTDCFVVRPDGTKHSIKVLSNGIVKGNIDRFLDGNSFIDCHRTDAIGFWANAKIRFNDATGNVIQEVQCVDSSSGGAIRFVPEVTNATRQSTRQYEINAGIEAPVLAARLILQIPLQVPLPDLEVRLGTTRGTNALLTRTGAKTAFLTTRGFADVLEIAYQERPDLFALNIVKRKPLYDRVIEIDERVGNDGTVLVPLDTQRVSQTLAKLKEQGIDSIAICFLHGYKFPGHEAKVAQLAEQVGFRYVRTSSRIATTIKMVSRGETTVVDAYLGPVVRDYLKNVHRQFFSDRIDAVSDFSESPAASNVGKLLRVMTSNGGLVSHHEYMGKDSVLSGPSGGVVALTKIAQASGNGKVIGLDMGGTSTDVCRIDGQPLMEYETIKAGVRLMTPMLAIHTVAAGGGSVCRFDGVQWQVGPQSAGAMPGPACYGRGGPLTVTDLNCILGRVITDRFPFALDLNASKEALKSLWESARSESGNNEQGPTDSVVGQVQQPESPVELAIGLRKIANEIMAAAVRRITIAQGADPRSHVLVGFGGAAGQHLCEIADILQIETLLDPPDAGMLSALGIGLAAVSRWSTIGVYKGLDELSEREVSDHFEHLANECRSQLKHEQVDLRQLEYKKTVDLRYRGTDQPLSIPFHSFNRLHSDFEAAHRNYFGYIRPGRAVEIVAFRTEATAESTNRILPITPYSGAKPVAKSLAKVSFYSGGELRLGWAVDRDDLDWGTELYGPGIVVSKGSTTVIDVGWTASVLSDLTLLIKKDSQNEQSITALEASKSNDPILREVLAQRFAAIADSMGIVLEQTSISVNIKERRDFSCAVFTATGELIANAPHVPVHLGAMGETVCEIIREFPKMADGDVFITNDPYRGGSHLPDVTVVTPVFNAAGCVLFFVANRAHHAEIGGLAPGSMSPLTKVLEEEGVIIPPTYLCKSGVDQSDAIRKRLSSAKYPSRSVDENIADIMAQQAANLRGKQSLLELVDEYSWSVTETYCEHILAAADAKVERWIREIGDTQFCFTDFLDDGTPISVLLEFISGRLRIDFEGTGPVSQGNFNANPAIVKAAVLYVIRLMIQDSLPMNSGVLRRIEIRVPHGILNPRSEVPLEQQPAVAAGNVETSQRVVDCLLGALGVAGASQGTMNNLLMGNTTFGYYETICGGSGATAKAVGASAVHTHMTNTRLTDPEVLESRYPVRLTKFEIRKGSGGDGSNRGGDGIVREILMMQDLDVSLVTSRRGAYPPYGMKGGLAGKIGRNSMLDADGNQTMLGSTCQIKVQAGERIRIETPGGGGFGEPDECSS